MTAFTLQAETIDRREAGVAAALSLAYVFSVWASLRLNGPGIPPFWVCNAFVAALVILADDRRLLWPALLFCGLGLLPLMLTTTYRFDLAAQRSLFNLIEGMAAGWLAQRVLGPRRLLRSAAGFLKLELLAIAPAVLGVWMLRDLCMRVAFGLHVPLMWSGATLPHMLGLAVMLPALLLLFQPTLPELRRSWIETVAILAGLGLFTHLIFNVSRMPASYLLSPLLLLTAFRLGPRGSIFGHLVVALVCLPATIGGGGPFSLAPHWNLQFRATLYQAILLSSVFGVSLCAFMVAEHARLRRLLVLRAASAREARRRALAASRSKTEFLATMSHEIRTPMNSILGFTQVLGRNPRVPKAAQDQVRLIAEAGGSLMTVLNDILDFSKVEAGQIDLCLEPVEVAALAAGTVEIMKGPAAAKGLAMRLETEGVEGRFRADGQRLRQVLLNLINNAVKFTDEGHVLVQVVRDQTRGLIRFEVHDSGIGIEEEVIGRLFTRFSQADSSTTRHYGGSGLGLAICKGLVQRMGGAIGVDSRPGSGSRFWFEIPAERIEGEGLAEAEAAPPRALGGRVLLVDDHPMNRMLGETLLQMLGCDVDLAASGEEAVQAASAKAYDAILMDVHMPRMDGLAATRAIRALGGPVGRVPVIAMSADVLPQNIERCRKAGMVDYVAKPVQTQTLHAVLGRWIVEQKQRSAA